MADAKKTDKITRQTTGNSEQRSRDLFLECPVPLLEEDFTDLKQHLDKLRSSGITDIRAHLAGHPEEVVTYAGLVRIVGVNRATLSLYEAPDEKSLLAGLSTLFTEESFGEFQEIMIALFEGKNQFDAAGINRTLRGKKIHVNLKCSLLPDSDGKSTRALVSIEDITDRKRVEDALRNSETIFRDFVFAQPDPIEVLALDGTVLMCNDASAAAYGSTTAERTGRNAFDGIPPEVATERRGLLDRVKTTRQRFWINEHHQGRFYETMLSPIADHSGEVVKVAIFPHDVTNRKKTEEALRESEQKFRNLAEESPNMIFINKKGRIVFANKRCEDITGYSRDDFYLPGFDFMGLIAPEHRERVKRNFRNHLSGEDIQPYEYTLITKSGKRVESIITTKLIDFEGEQAILGIITDITERKRMEEALRESRKFLETIIEAAPT